MVKISEYLKNQPVLVTGAGGSIGSELCRQISQIKPSLLIMIDHAESNLFEIEEELKSNSIIPRLISVVGDIRDRARMSVVFQKYHPAVVFHAAAYKHVPMMEKNPRAALENNFIGTHIIAELALKFGVKKFVLISTDKAVNPLNIMGASKALAERVIQTMPEVGPTKFITVRFGNVLASRGSVVPIFKEQIARGGPITVTHPEMKRYFMTIPESVQLIIQAGALGNGGEIFVLDMGEQIKIKDLAENMIRLSGFEPEKDIKIEYSGIRLGEKLDEELFNDDETELPTAYDKIFMVGKNNLDKAKLREQLFELEELIKQQRMKLAFKKISELLPSYKIDSSFPK
ncbi:MAG: polysaccharide biosynthesis protein [Actinobacteria bacterium]|nr:polysaccharide biosynthesis protein [Actinomycetota bacterium]